MTKRWQWSLRGGTGIMVMLLACSVSTAKERVEMRLPLTPVLAFGVDSTTCLSPRDNPQAFTAAQEQCVMAAQTTDVFLYGVLLPCDTALRVYRSQGVSEGAYVAFSVCGRDRPTALESWSCVQSAYTMHYHQGGQLFGCFGVPSTRGQE